MRTPWVWARGAILPLLISIGVAACDDPSNVGLGLIGEGDSEPMRVELSGSELPAERAAPVTGGVRSGATFTGPPRYLIGAAEDPIFGTIEAKGYVDFSTPASIGNNFRNGTVTSVDLFMSSDGYAYGDTSVVMRYVVSDMDVAWTAFTTRSDTTLTPGDTVVSKDFQHAEGGFIISMPESWVEENGDVLLDDDFTDLFNGFEISVTGPGVISGFLGLPGILRVTTTTGVAEYPMSKILTTISKSGVTEIPGRTIIQDGFGQNAILDFEFEIDSIAGAAVSRAVVDVRVDLSAYDNPPPNFVRPLPAVIDLIGIAPDGVRRVLRSAQIGSEGRVSFVSSTASVGEFTLVRSVQLAVTGNSLFDRYAVAISDPQASIGAALLYNGTATEDQPEAVLTLVPSPFLR